MNQLLCQIPAALVALATLLCCASPTNAQYPQERSPTKKSTLVKLQEFHHKVKQKLGLVREQPEQATLQPTTSPTTSAEYSQPVQHRFESGSRPPMDNRNYQNSYIQTAQYQEPGNLQSILNRNGVQDSYQEPNRQENQIPNGAMVEDYRGSSVSQGVGSSQLRFQPPNSIRPNEYPPSMNRVGDTWQQDIQSTNVPPIESGASTYSETGINGNPMRSGHFLNGMPIDGQRLAEHQITATQRALELEAENKILVSTRESLKSEIRRLNQLLDENRKLIERAQRAIQLAKSELSEANLRNQELREKVAKLESEKEQIMLESNRQLESIRKRLDDLLMREMIK